MAAMTPLQARNLWRAYLENATQKILDADLLEKNGSVGSAQALAVIAQEEFAKAVWIYSSFESAWTAAATEPRSVPEFNERERDHVAKNTDALLYGDDLDRFWGGVSDYPHLDSMPWPGEPGWEEAVDASRKKSEARGGAANRAKQAGLYVGVNLQSMRTQTPSELDRVAVAEEIRRIAQVIEMMLINDHTRMAYDTEINLYESAQDLHRALLDVAHSDMFRDPDPITLSTFDGVEVTASSGPAGTVCVHGLTLKQVAEALGTGLDPVERNVHG